MIIFEKKQLFDKYTGKPIGEDALMPIKHICDFCGEDIDTSQEERSYRVLESDSSEPWFSQMSLVYKDQKIDLYDLFDKHPKFVYCCDYDEDWFCEVRMLYEAFQDFNDNRQDVRNFLIINTLYESRLKMIKKVFEVGLYNPAHFGLEFQE